MAVRCRASPQGGRGWFAGRNLAGRFQPKHRPNQARELLHVNSIRCQTDFGRSEVVQMVPAKVDAENFPKYKIGTVRIGVVLVRNKTVSQHEQGSQTQE